MVLVPVEVLESEGILYLSLARSGLICLMRFLEGGRGVGGVATHDGYPPCRHRGLFPFAIR